ncbi:hypothetical protein [Nocardia suismassiliense]|uniref:hypothetical protein n=1 Tax=Nocardia suismassiliense TaxID=2077092 RepID=UPI00131F3B83|nr:hypothetical protein [Nocardia suismassiliense]
MHSNFRVPVRVFAAAAIAVCVSVVPAGLAAAQELFPATPADEQLCEEEAAAQAKKLGKARLEQRSGPQVTCFFTDGTEEVLARKDGSSCLLADGEKKGRVDEGKCKPIAAKAKPRR